MNLHPAIVDDPHWQTLEGERAKIDQIENREKAHYAEQLEAFREADQKYKADVAQAQAIGDPEPPAPIFEAVPLAESNLRHRDERARVEFMQRELVSAMASEKRLVETLLAAEQTERSRLRNTPFAEWDLSPLEQVRQTLFYVGQSIDLVAFRMDPTGNKGRTVDVRGRVRSEPIDDSEKVLGEVVVWLRRGGSLVMPDHRDLRSPTRSRSQEPDTDHYGVIRKARELRREREIAAERGGER
jgi:hypothetical protein